MYVCLYIIFTGQITSIPANKAVSVGQNITITCNTGNNALVPSLLINSQSADNNPQVIDVTPVGSPNGLKVFLFSSATHENNGIFFTCTDTTGSLILNVLCKLLYYIMYIDISIYSQT